MSDYLTNATYLIIKEAEGPNILNNFVYGRQDVKTAEEAGDVRNIPTESNYRSNLQA